MEPQNFKRITYLSTAIAMFTHESLMELAEHAARMNAEKMIGGVLYYKGGQFLQVIEGPTEAIDQLWSNLLKDQRHAWVEALLVEEHVNRAFDGWGMGLCDMDDDAAPPRAEFTAIAKFLKNCSDLDELAVVKGLLNHFENSSYTAEAHEAA